MSGNGTDNRILSRSQRSSQGAGAAPSRPEPTAYFLPLLPEGAAASCCSFTASSAVSLGRRLAAGSRPSLRDESKYV